MAPTSITSTTTTPAEWEPHTAPTTTASPSSNANTTRTTPFGSTRTSLPDNSRVVPSPRWSVTAARTIYRTRDLRRGQHGCLKGPSGNLQNVHWLPGLRTGELHYRHAPSIYASCQGVMF